MFRLEGLGQQLTAAIDQELYLLLKCSTSRFDLKVLVNSSSKQLTKTYGSKHLAVDYVTVDK